jgi:uncharacterized protein (DUF1800 family)
MRRVVLTATAAACAAVLAPLSGKLTSGSFDKRLSGDLQIVQVLSRMTFGVRAADIEEVRRVGVNRWIDQQLHPDQIAENPVLEDKLKPLETLRMPVSEIFKQYVPEPNMIAVIAPLNDLNTLLTDEQRRKVLTGTAEERSAILKTLDDDKRKRVLGALPQNVVSYTPEYKEEAEAAQKARQEMIREETRKRNPQLRDLLTPDQVVIANSGDREKIVALFASLDPDKQKQIASLLPQKSLAVVPEYRREGMKRRTPRMVPAEDLREAKLYRAIYSNRQLEEVLVDFWFNHFNVDVNKNVQMANNQMPMMIGSYERDAIRPHVLGHFKDLLLATARHPAMLYYLDNWQSMAPNSVEVGPFAPVRGVLNGVPNSIIPTPLSRQAHGLNENYGREVMELHTLGVKGGYTQDDVIAVARCFTGWTVRSPDNPEFVFAPFMHDFGEKTVLGHKIPAGGGERDGLDVIDILARHPSAAKFISLELARRFVADEPPQALVTRMAMVFTKTDGDLRAVLEAMFKSPEFLSEGAWQAKVKSPSEVVASSVRATGADVTDAFTLVQKIAEMGAPLYGKLEPNGYPETGEAWLSSAGMMARMNFAVTLAEGKLPGVKVDSSRWAGKTTPVIAKDLLGRDASANTIEVIEGGFPGRKPEPAMAARLILSSPDFERR